MARIRCRPSINELHLYQRIFAPENIFQCSGNEILHGQFVLDPNPILDIIGKRIQLLFVQARKGKGIEIP